ncbi:tryptophan halogenase family protein [Stakelama marina]|uniref:Tryptophan 7-halogenase n=1 Tax=Stakelama marina TaxID=2826939 RepID=A0A8T4IJK1_9SPHN|nr:tryptophan 7-halogenase [Stakelama marina]MBR0552529.1 tryptophan 7-halogenase [Stakelama marina]
MQPVRKLVIVGGGTAGWMVAAAAARFLTDGQRTITLVESDAIGTVGVGEATIPPIRSFNQMLGIDEGEFVRATGATMKLGIEFVGWGVAGDRYLHPFGDLGYDFEGVAFHQFWLKHRGQPDIGALDDYWLSAAAIRAGRFAPPAPDPRSPLSTLAYAYHFDATLYARFLRERAEAGGVTRVEGRIGEVDTDDYGNVGMLTLEDGRTVEGDFFIDCSGFRSLLLGKALGVGYRDWSRWLPCDRAMAVPSRVADPLPPMTRATALGAGWQWRIPLQHRTGNGLVYSSAHMGDEDAERTLLSGLEEPAEGEPRKLSFTAGVRERQWEKNVVALGLAAGFVEPLESTSIHLIQTAINKLFWLFPAREISQVERDEFNMLMTDAYEYVRDFIILHYKATTRTDTDFWRDARAMDVPDSLARKIALFREKGRVRRFDHDLFAVPSWVAVMLGQHIEPEGYDPLADSMEDDRVLEAMRRMRTGYAKAAQQFPRHEEYLARLTGGVSAR